MSGLHFVWIHGYLGSSTTFNSLPRDLAQVFKATNHFITYSFDVAFQDATMHVQQSLADLFEQKEVNLLDIVVFAHSMGGLILINALRNINVSLKAICLFDVPFGGVKQTYIQKVGKTKTEDALRYLVPQFGFDIQKMQQLMTALEDLAEDDDTKDEKSSNTNIKDEDEVDDPDLEFLLNGPLQPLLQNYGSYLVPFLELHSRFLRPLFEPTHLAELRDHLANAFHAEGVACLHIKIDNSGEHACFEYMDLPNSKTWYNHNVDISNSKHLSVFAPLTAHTTLFTTHNVDMFDECYCFIKNYLNLKAHHKANICSRTFSVVKEKASWSMYISIIVCCVAMLLVNKWFQN